MKFASLTVAFVALAFAEAHDGVRVGSRERRGDHVRSRSKGVEYRVGNLSVDQIDPRSGNPQTEPCTLVASVEETKEGDKTQWYCMVVGDDARSAGLESGNDAVVKIEGIGYAYEAFDGELISGETNIFAEGALISDDFTMRIPEDAKITFTKAISSRAIKSSVGTKKVLIARVTTSDGKEPSVSAAVMSDKNFGTNGDIVNTKSVFEGCSHNQMIVVPATGNGVVNGAIEVSVDVPANNNSFEILSKVYEKLQQHFGVSNRADLATVFDFVLVGCPPGVMSPLAWANENTPHSVYNDKAITWPTTTVHEMGHNLNLHHAWEGNDPEGDHQGMMGYVEDFDEGKKGKLCFNPAKNWFIGWYDDRLHEVKPHLSEYSGKLIGVANYDKISGDDKIALKIAGPSGEQDYYIGYNHADGWNEGTHESINQVTVVKQKPEMELSYKVASLSQGQEYKISNYLNLGSDVTIKVNSIDSTLSTGYADIQICYGECGGSPPTPTPPTPTPPTPTPPTGGCTDLAGWFDSFGDGCQYYEDNNGACEAYKDDVGTGGKTPVDACCVCKDTSSGSPPTDPPTTAPFPVPTDAPTSGGCTNVSGWTDSYGDGCEYYENPDNEGACEAYKDDIGTDGYTPIGACCVCK